MAGKFKKTHTHDVPCTQLHVKSGPHTSQSRKHCRPLAYTPCVTEAYWSRTWRHLKLKFRMQVGKSTTSIPDTPPCSLWMVGTGSLRAEDEHRGSTMMTFKCWTAASDSFRPQNASGRTRTSTLDMSLHQGSHTCAQWECKRSLCSPFITHFWRPSVWVVLASLPSVKACDQRRTPAPGQSGPRPPRPRGPQSPQRKSPPPGRHRFQTAGGVTRSRPRTHSCPARRRCMHVIHTCMEEFLVFPE